MASVRNEPRHGKGGSNRIASVDVERVTNNDDHQLPTSKHFDSLDETTTTKVPTWRKFLSFVGPGFLVSLAYLDPGNLETDLQAGANHRYELLWVILVGLIFAMIIQSLAANLGVSTGKHLAEVCKAEYPVVVKYCLWLLAEVAVIAADIPEVIGTAFALNILFHIPVWVRKLEMLIALLVFVMAACFFGEMAYAKPPAKDVLKGLFIPKLNGNSATGDAIALMGALVMPHNLFLHSALVLSRKVPKSVKGINEACKFFLWESGFALFIALLINIAVISVSGTACYSRNTGQLNPQCNDLTLNSASFLLQNVLGRKSASIIYAVALLASGQSSTITGTYAGQFIMQGFLDIKMRKWLRNLMTRTIAIAPSLVVSIIGGSAGAGKLIIIASMILSFELPFALIPLLKFSSGATKMGPHKNSLIIIIISWILGLAIICINVYYLITGFIDWIMHNSLPKFGNVLIGIVVFPLMGIYVGSVIYLMFRKDRVVTFIEPVKVDQLEMGDGHEMHEAATMDNVPYREDLADIPLPR
ncbi:hypothetical protein KSS87_002487 [Heliosperma pusillum]|nr:hypothetical protein KSS87_002487 [Heliosperma pusillum]